MMSHGDAADALMEDITATVASTIIIAGSNICSIHLVHDRVLGGVVVVVVVVVVRRGGHVWMMDYIMETI
jgi:hypothetical protein